MIYSLASPVKVPAPAYRLSLVIYHVWSFLGPLPPTPLACVSVIALHDVVPVDVQHERLDIRCRLRPIIDVIGVFVHIEGEDRHPTREATRMIRRPLIDQ